MTESTDTEANCQLDSIQISIDQQQDDSIYDDFGLFSNDGDEDNLTLFDLKSLPKSNHDLSIFDELVQQCQDVISLTNHSQERTLFTICNNKLDLSNTSTMINEYQQRFQKSLQKLTVPSWYNNRPLIIPKYSSKTFIDSHQQHSSKLDSHRTPEIVHIHRPHSYRSCRSSIGTSPSPSAHSWHPNCLIDGTNFTSGLPTSNSTNTYRHKKYQKGIERVTKFSQWYQPTQFKDKKQSISNHTQENFEKNSVINHYDTPKKFNSTSSSNDPFVENLTINNRADISLTFDKQDDKSNEISIMSLENKKPSFDRVELEEITDDDDDKTTTTNKTSTIERLADNLVESILNEIRFSKISDQDDDELNTGVRELSDDENALRELDENDMSDTDEFIVFATNDDATELEITTDCSNENPRSPLNYRNSSNRLYTFSRNQDDDLVKNSSNQDTSTAASDLMIADKDLSTTTTNLNVNEQNNSIDDQDSLPIYRSHIQKRHINLGRYYDGMMRPSTSHIPTYNIRYQNDSLPATNEGVTEETVRTGRILLDQIPKMIELNKTNNHESLPIRSILKNTRSNHEKKSHEDLSLKIIEEQEEEDRKSPKKVITMITEEYHRIHRKIIEETLDDFTPKPIQPTIIDQCPYQKLSDCYSGYSHLRNDKLTVPSNISSLQTTTTTDEAYESEHTTASPTNSSSIIAHIHPDLAHEFDYPSPPPPVPDRRLKPAHLRPPPPPPTKPRTLLNQQETNSNRVVYSKIQKHQTKSSPLAAIQHLMATNTNQSTSTSTARTLSSRHFCGVIPTNNDLITSSQPTDTTETKFKRNSKISSKIRPKKPVSSSNFDEATNGLAIRLPASDSSTNRTSTPSANKRTTPTTKQRPMSENISANRSSVYETSV